MRGIKRSRRERHESTQDTLSSANYSKMKLGSSHGDAYNNSSSSGGGEGGRGGGSGGGSLSISAVMQDLKEKFKNDEDSDHSTSLSVEQTKRNEIVYSRLVC